MVFSGFEYGVAAFKLREVSVNSPVGVPVWPIKIVILFSGFFLLVQGSAEVMRCIYCIKTGRWLERGVDVNDSPLSSKENLRD